MSFSSLLQSKKFRIALCAIGVLAAGFLIFHAGVWTGSRKAYFFCRRESAFGRREPRGSFFAPFPPRMSSTHSVSGTISEIRGADLFLNTGNGETQEVDTDGGTVVRTGRHDSSYAELKVGERVMVLGDPDEDGRIKARLVRIFSGQAGPAVTQ